MGFWIHTLWHWVTSRSPDTWSAIATCVNAATVIVLSGYTIKATRSAEGTLAEARHQSALASAQHALVSKDQQRRDEAAFYKATYELERVILRILNLRRALRDGHEVPTESPMGDYWHEVMAVLGGTVPSTRAALTELGQHLLLVDQEIGRFLVESTYTGHYQTAAEELLARVEEAWKLQQKVSDVLNEHVESKKRSDVETTTAPPL
jgi:hypothetical protein